MNQMEYQVEARVGRNNQRALRRMIRETFGAMRYAYCTLQKFNDDFKFQPMVGNLLPTRVSGFGFSLYLP